MVHKMMRVETGTWRMNLHHRGLSNRRLWCLPGEFSSEVRQELEGRTATPPQLLREGMEVYSPITISMIMEQSGGKGGCADLVPYRDHGDIVLGIKRSPHFSFQFLQNMGIFQQ
jgi:hypothetical protein